MPLSAPITHTQHVVFRAAVIDFKERSPRGRVPVAVHVGRPGGDERTVARHVVEPGQELDQALRTDIAAALLQRTSASAPHRWAWLTRSGSLELHDADVAWCAAWYAACAEGDVDVPLLVVTRTGWCDPRTGVTRAWSRLRRRSAGPPRLLPPSVGS